MGMPPFKLRPKLRLSVSSDDWNCNSACMFSGSIKRRINSGLFIIEFIIGPPPKLGSCDVGYCVGNPIDGTLRPAAVEALEAAEGEEGLAKEEKKLGISGRAEEGGAEAEEEEDDQGLGRGWPAATLSAAGCAAVAACVGSAPIESISGDSELYAERRNE